MHDLLLFIKAHELIIVMIGYWFFSSVVSALPMPGPTDSKLYSFVFALFHSMAGSLGRVMAMRYPLQAEKIKEVPEEKPGS